jgi:hypothetical protein
MILSSCDRSHADATQILISYFLKMKIISRRLKTLSLLFVATLIGCSSTPQGAIDVEKKAVERKSVKISIASPIAHVVINQDNMIADLCAAGASCGGGKNISFDISSEGIGLSRKYPQEISCGTGARGFLSKIPNGENLCGSRLYKVSDLHLTQRIVGGIISWGVLPLLEGTVHEESFSSDGMRDIADEAQIQGLKEILYSGNSSKLSYLGLGQHASVIYVDIDRLDQAYKEYLKSDAVSDSLVLIDRKTKKPLYVFCPTDYSGLELPAVVEKQMADFINYASGEKTLTSKVNIKSLIPGEIPLPKLPSVPQLTKSQFETKLEFEQRIKEEVLEREESIRQIQQKYNQDVAERNAYVAALSNAWEKTINASVTQQNELVRNVKDNQVQLARLLFAFNYGRFKATDFTYDAENQKIYLTVNSARYSFKQKLVAVMQPALAKSVFSGHYVLTPNFDVQQSKIIMNGFSLVESNSGKEFQTSYTDVNFKPDLASVQIATNSKINPLESAAFHQYEQKPATLVDTGTKEVWYINTVKQMNAQMPDWFSNPEQGKLAVGYGVGNSLDEAMNSARKELAYAIKTSISSSMNLLKEDNSFRSYQEVKENTKAVTDVQFSSGDTSVLHQAMMDGRYYVAMCYQCEKK